jgi:preprotein translocase subunit SecA
VQLATGEGKTLVGALAAALEVWRGRRVHVGTVNDYLAARDAAWMAPVLAAAGVGVASVGSTATPEQRRAAYRADVVYAPLTEIGFDELRDGLVEHPGDRVLDGRSPHGRDHLLVDEVDALLVDAARIPLVVAGSWGDAGDDLAAGAARIVADLEPGLDVEVDAARTTAWLTERGTHVVEHAAGLRLVDDEGHALATAVNLALHARFLLERDVDYLVVDGTVHLVDTSRGRLAHLRRWPDGLQEAVEVREGLARTSPGAILDQSTIPALVRGYRSVAGMSGTAFGAREELDLLYRLAVVRVPPHRPCVRVDEPLRAYADAAARDAAVVARTAEAHGRGQPVLVGTGSVAASEHVAALLAAAGVPHVVLNARNDAAEAALVARAGAPGAVTVSTQMAGRGTDIVLGGGTAADETGSDGGETGDAQARVRASGGLLVLGVGLHPSSRLDEQLVGRSGRQGDPGRSALYAALDDDLVVAASPDAPEQWVDAANDDGLVTDAGALRAVRHAQRAAEGAALEAVRSTWRYHAVVAGQRAEVQAARAVLLAEDDATADLVRRVRLAVLDRRWSDHLALLADLRETIHLRALARANPWLSFNADAERAFAPLLAEAADEAGSLLAEHPHATDLAGLGLRRPSATWIYVLDETALGDGLDRVVRRVRTWLDRRPG